MSETSSIQKEKYFSIASSNVHFDLDLPNYQPTKYNSCQWKLFHIIFYSIFSFCFFLFPIRQLLSLSNDFCYLIGSASFIFATTIEWTHFTRGCIFPSNLNSNCKTNIDQTCQAKILRMRLGITYFISVIGSVILLCGSIISFYLKGDEWNSDQFLFTSNMIFVFITISKIDKVVTPTKQYFFLNDLSNSLYHFFFLLGSLFYTLGTIVSLLPIIHLTYYYSQKLHLYIQGIGGIFYIFSTIIMIYRYFCSGFDDLNMENVSVFSY